MQGNSNLIAYYANHFMSVFSPLGLGPQQQPQLYRAASQTSATIQAHLTSIFLSSSFLSSYLNSLYTDAR